MQYGTDDILGFETDTVWGIGCHPLNRNSAEKIYELKKRDKLKPLILMSSKIEYLMPYIKEIPVYAQSLIKNFFPGALTLIFEKSDICPFFITSNKNTVGIRIPNHKDFFEIAESFENNVLATTSLNLSDEPPVLNYDEAVSKFGSEIKIIKPKYNEPSVNMASTVVLCTENTPVVLRQGSVYLS